MGIAILIIVSLLLINSILSLLTLISIYGKCNDIIEIEEREDGR